MHNAYIECPVESNFHLPFGFSSLSGKLRLSKELLPDLEVFGAKWRLLKFQCWVLTSQVFLLLIGRNRLVMWIVELELDWNLNLRR